MSYASNEIYTLTNHVPLYNVVNTGLFINNEFVAGANTIDTINPATGKVITAVQAGMSLLECTCMPCLYIYLS